MIYFIFKNINKIIIDDIMVDPVVANDGYTYDRKNIEEWWQKSDLSPMTGLPIESKSLIPNHTLKSAISSWNETMGFQDKDGAEEDEEEDASS